MMNYGRGRGVVLFAALSVVASPSHGALVGSEFSGAGGAGLYWINTQTGAATQRRATGIDRLVGIAFSPQGGLYGLSSASSASQPNSLSAIDPVTGTSQAIGSTGLTGITEGDLCFDPTSGSLYGLYNLTVGQRQMFTIDKTTGAATPLLFSLSGDPSAMAFDAAGQLFVLDTSLGNLLKVDKTTGSVLSIIPLSVNLGSEAGMAFDPVGHMFFVADGGSGGTNALYVLDANSGVLTVVGGTGAASGIAGLAFSPEPSTAVFLSLSLVMLRRQCAR